MSLELTRALIKPDKISLGSYLSIESGKQLHEGAEVLKCWNALRAGGSHEMA